MSNSKINPLRSVYIVDGLRTPMLKARAQPGPFSASDLAVQACRALLIKQSFSPQQIDEIVTGCTMPSAYEANISRIIALRIGCGDAVPAYTVQRNCGSGLQAIDNAMQDIMRGNCDLVLAGGTEAMSHAPILFNSGMVHWLAAWNSAKSLSIRAKVASQFRLRFLKPVIALICGLTDPIVNLSMGQTAENLAFRFHITREQMDAYALQSHQRLATAIDQNHLAQEVTPIYDDTGKYYMTDDGLRRDTSLERLAQLKPFFDKPFGLVTAGNSSQITDGAAFVILASGEAVKKYQLPVLGRIIDTAWAALDPAEMGLGPVYATAKLLQQQNLNLADIDYWELNEAFAAQVLACLTAMRDKVFCQRYLSLTDALGEIPMSRLNLDGGAVALGHPVGASGARITLHLLHVLKRMKLKRGIATICIGGGQGGAMLLEQLDGVA